ncbi:hypothetical protein Cs7R123_15400 [Catellatospora sp. TT07R-123]|uniref:condensation domain-containing protein n=1 Tax=Catellatospora sp. TT07R-123 TaxID=2733863 RepID=UPI001B0A41A3|nr:condensation domain-containing protein [Catellatospora sp. TT07R-123]GHJ44198.1 hypothetical protein Cs7R123_15400 [Catellatospora sp. TT07R-123]
MSISEAAAAPAAVDLPLSLQQEFLRLFDRGDAEGPFGPRYIVADGWRVGGEVDLAALRQALDDVAARHESLRTTIVRGEEGSGQRVSPPSAVSLTVRDLPGVDPADRGRVAEELVNEIEAQTYSIRQSPLLWAVLGRFDRTDSVLVLVTHHTAADAWSMQVVMRDVASCYAARVQGREPGLEPAAQYGEYAVAQLEQLGAPSVQRAREYWRKTLDGARILTVPADKARGAEEEAITGWYRFLAGAELRTGTARLAESTHSSPFMVLLAAFNVLASRQTGSQDIVVPTFTPGRGQARFQKTVGSFFNFVPLRTDLTGCATFRDVVARTRATCLGAYSHEVPLLVVLQEAPELMASLAAPGVAPALFQVIQPPFVMEREQIGGLEFSAIWRRVITQEIGSDIPDGVLWSLHLGPTEEIVGAIGYSAHLFTTQTLDRSTAEYVSLLGSLLASPDAPLAGL